MGIGKEFDYDKSNNEIVGASDVPSYDIEDNDNNFEPTITQRLDKLEWYTRKLFKGDVDFAEMTAAQLLAILAKCSIRQSLTAIGGQRNIGPMSNILGSNLNKRIKQSVAQLMGCTIKATHAVRVRSIKLIGKGDAKWK